MNDISGQMPPYESPQPAGPESGTFDVGVALEAVRGDTTAINPAIHEIGAIAEANGHFVTDGRRVASVIDGDRDSGSALAGLVRLAEMSGGYSERTSRLGSATVTVRSGTGRMRDRLEGATRQAHSEQWKPGAETSIVQPMEDATQMSGRILDRAGELRDAAESFPPGSRFIDAVVQLGSALNSGDSSSVDAALTQVNTFLGEVAQCNEEVKGGLSSVSGTIDSLHANLDAMRRMRAE